MTPPQLHMHLEFMSSAGMFPMSTVGTPGTQGAEVTGMHGMGVRTPSAAAVAAATMGFARLEHMPNGEMFTMGTWSMMLAMGARPTTPFVGSTLRGDGATPKLHCRIAPVLASIAMAARVYGVRDVASNIQQRRALAANKGTRDFHASAPLRYCERHHAKSTSPSLKRGRKA